MALTYHKFDDECEVPLEPLNGRELLWGAVLCAAIGIALVYLSLAPVWLIVVLAIFYLPFVFKSVSVPKE